MIRFACKQCGKRHERPDSEAGTLVFCDCGQGNRVPWESTLPPPEPERSAARPDEDAAEDWQPTPPSRRRAEDYPEPQRRREEPAWDPAYCFNHPESPAERTCADCGVGFCSDCVVTLQGETLCGPCKNLRVRRLHQRPRISGLAVASLVIGLLGGPFGFCLVAAAAGGGAPAVGWGGLVLPLVALTLGVVSLNQIETDPKVGGRSLALTGVLTGLVGVIVAAVMTVLTTALAG